jgi:hypothetical protein
MITPRASFVGFCLRLGGWIGFASVMAATACFATARLGPLNTSGGVGATVDIPVGFTSSENVTCLQFDVLFDAAKISLGTARTGTAAAGHQIQSRLLSTGRHRVLIYSTTLEPLNGGYIVQLPVTWTAAGDSALAVDTVRLADTGGTAVAFTSSTLSPGISSNAPGGATAGADLALNVEPTAGTGVTYEWRYNGQVIAGATSPTLSFTNAQRFHAGTYEVTIVANGLTLSSQSFALMVNPPPANSARLLNLSTRAQSLTGDDVLIPGFVVAGTASKRLLIRAVGPTLGKAPFGIPGVLPDPRMRLMRRNPSTTSFEEIAANDNWGTNTNATDITQTAADLFAFAFNDDREAALLLDLPPGEYTVIAGGVNDTTGLAIVELYDADAGSPGSRLINISNRGFCGAGDQVMIPGFVISSEGPKTVLIRVVGPTLGGFGVAGTMADPKLEVYPGGASQPIFANDNWGDTTDAAYTAQVAQDIFAFPLNAGSKDAAFVLTLQPGIYTVVGSSAVVGGTGVVLVEVYVIQ